MAPDAPVKDDEITAYKALFDQLDTDHDGEISLAELQAAMKDVSELVISRSSRLRALRKELERGQGGVGPKEFTEVMKELFWLSYAPFFRSSHMEAELTARAWEHVIGEDGSKDLLREETSTLHCFQSLKRKPRQERVEIFRTLLCSMVDSVAESMADTVISAGEYELQQEQGGEFRSPRKSLYTPVADNALSEASGVVASFMAGVKGEEPELRALGVAVLEQCEEVVMSYRSKEEGHFNEDARHEDASAIRDALTLRPWTAGVLDLYARYGVSVSELAQLNLRDHLPSSEREGRGASARGKAACAVSRQRGLVEGEGNAIDSRGHSALMRQVVAGDVGNVRLLLASGAAVNTELNGSDEGVHSSPLFVACQRGLHEMAAVLVEEGGAEVNARDEEGNVPLLAAIQDDRIECVRVLLEHGADPNTTGAKYFDPPICEALMRNIDVMELLVQRGADVNTTDRNGEHVLFTAMSLESVQAATVLLAAGSDANSVDARTGSTVFAQACAGGQKMEGVASLLLDKGADGMAKGHGGVDPLLNAAGSGMESVVARLLEMKASVNDEAFQGCSPLICAVCSKHEAVAILLIAHGADVNSANEDGVCALRLDLARKHGLEGVEKMLLEKGAVDPDPGPQDQDKQD